MTPRMMEPNPIPRFQFPRSLISGTSVAVLAVFHFSYMWNSFVWPLTVSTQDAMRTLPVGLANLQTVQNTDYTLLMAAATFTAVPMIVVFFAAQRFFHVSRRCDIVSRTRCICGNIR